VTAAASTPSRTGQRTSRLRCGRPDGVAGDLSPEEQGVVYTTHFAPALDLFNEKHDGIAWRSKPSWSIVATEGRTVHPDLERFAAKRMDATTIELKSSHVPMLSQPGSLLDVIRKAAKVAQNRYDGRSQW